MPEINIVPFDKTFEPQLAEFYQRVHPHIRDAKARLAWFNYGNPFKTFSEGILGLWGVTKEGKVIGEYKINEIPWYYKQKCYPGFTGFDHFVDEAYRPKGIGGWLLIRIFKRFKPYFGTGLTQAVLPLYRRAHVPCAGVYYKFLWLNNPFLAIKDFLACRAGKEKRWPPAAFPQTVKVEEYNFHLIQGDVPASYKPYYDDHLIEFIRAPEFLKWRFFHPYRKYHFYFCDQKSFPLYVVLRQGIYKGLSLIVISDIKFPFHDPVAGQATLQVAQVIARELRADGVITISSHPEFDQILKSRRFFRIGNPAEMYSNNWDSLEGNVKPMFHVTLTDSDLDLNFGDRL